RTIPSLLEFTGSGTDLAMTQRFAPLPPAVEQALGNANNASKAWTPSPEDLATVAREWDNLTPRETHINTIETEIVSHDSFDESFRSDAQTKDAIWAIRQVETYHPSGAPTVKEIVVYGTLEPKDGGWVGTYTHATIAAAPFPIPIVLKGKFQLYRLSAGGG